MNDAPSRDQLPLPDYDHIPQGTLPTRITGLDEQQLEQLLAYEREHGDRLPVVQVLQQRLEALRSGAEPSGAAAPDTPEVTEASSGSPVSPQTSGPTPVAPFHGNPAHQSQPEK